MIDWIRINLNRRKNDCGIEMNIEAVPKVEEFMANLGSGQSDPIEAYGRSWASFDPEHQIRVYRMFEPPDGRHVRYELDQPSSAFRNPTNGKINVSFLRMVGISDPDGVKFRVTTPISNGELEDLAKTLTFASRQFILDYMTPANVSLRIVGGE